MAWQAAARGRRDVWQAAAATREWAHGGARERARERGMSACAVRVVR